MSDEKSCFTCGVTLAEGISKRLCVRCPRAPFMVDSWKPRAEVETVSADYFEPYQGAKKEVEKKCH